MAPPKPPLAQSGASALTDSTSRACLSRRMPSVQRSHEAAAVLAAGPLCPTAGTPWNTRVTTQIMFETAQPMGVKKEHTCVFFGLSVEVRTS